MQIELEEGQYKLVKCQACDYSHQLALRIESNGWRIFYKELSPKRPHKNPTPRLDPRIVSNREEMRIKREEIRIAQTKSNEMLDRLEKTSEQEASELSKLRKELEIMKLKIRNKK